MISSIRTGVIHLAPGDFVSGTAQDRTILTVLGSCVSMLLWHPSSRFFACSHFVCVRNNHSPTSTHVPDGRYGDQILPYFLQLMQKKEIPLNDVQVRLCGGASSKHSQRLLPTFQVGQLNRDYAVKFCRLHGLRAELLYFGGETGIKLKFEAKNGSLQLRHLSEVGAPITNSFGHIT